MAVLALLTDAVPRDVLFAALGDWAKDRRQTLSQVLVLNRAIDPDHLRALICLSESHLARHENDLRACLDVWHAQGLTEEVLAGVEDVGLKTTLGVAAGLDATLASVVGQGAGDETIPANAGLDETIALVDGKSVAPLIAPRSSGGERSLTTRPH